MIGLLIDQNFNEHIAGGLIRRSAELDLMHIRDVGQAIEELLISVYCLSADECRDLIRYFPM